MTSLPFSQRQLPWKASDCCVSVSNAAGRSKSESALCVLNTVSKVVRGNNRVALLHQHHLHNLLYISGDLFGFSFRDVHQGLQAGDVISDIIVCQSRAGHVADVERWVHAGITGPLITELKHTVQMPDSIGVCVWPRLVV